MDRYPALTLSRLSFVVSLMVLTGACHASPPAAGSGKSSDDASLQLRIAALKEKTLKDLKPIEGGTFTMGDFGPIDPRVEMPYTGERDDDVLRKVTLSDYAMGAYKITYADFDVFTEATGRPKVAQQEMDLAYRDLPGIPAGVNWNDAQAYCQWIGQQVGKHMDLPTEAQWEYAARNRGQMVVWATDNGEVEDGRNVASYSQHKEFRAKHPGTYMTPVGHLPPTPLGLYDMIDHGFEWMRDWYAAQYDAKDIHDPQGPKSGKEKVQRSHSNHGGDSLAVVSMTMSRFHKPPAPGPMPSVVNEGENMPINQNFENTFRCIVNSR